MLFLLYNLIRRIFPLWRGQGEGKTNCHFEKQYCKISFVELSPSGGGGGRVNSNAVLKNNILKFNSIPA
jgi:hypothetical protein